MLELGSKEVGFDIQKKVRIRAIDWFKNISKNSAIKMEDVYTITGLSCQAYHKATNKAKVDSLLWQRLLETVTDFRQDYPRSSARKIHRKLKIKEVGINRFEQFVSQQGLSIKRQRSFIRTTYAGVEHYPNLVN